MAEALETNRFLDFGPYRLDRVARVLLRDRSIVPLTPKVLDTLVALVERRGEVVSKAELLETVWPDSFVEEGNLAQNVSAIRRALGQDGDGRIYIETVSKRGYRFVAEVKIPAVEIPEAPDTQTLGCAPKPASNSQSRFGLVPRRTLVAAAGFIGSVAVGTAFVRLRQNWRPIQSLAVLPLQNLSANPGEEYFADGMTEALTVDLGKISALRVISPPSVRRYKDAGRSVRDTARDLHVDALVLGSVLRSGSRVRITAQLIHAATGRLLWSDSYERNVSDVLALQSEVARRIAGEVRVTLTAPERARLARVVHVNAEAYDLFLRGQHLTLRRDPADQGEGIRMLERSVGLDPSFAPAHAALADAYVNTYVEFDAGARTRLEAKARASVETALSLDPDLAEAHVARGRFLWTPTNGFPHDQALREYHRATELNPGSHIARGRFAIVLNHIGMLDEAFEELQKAIAMNPSDSWLAYHLAMNMVLQGKFERALPVCLGLPPAFLASAPTAVAAHSLDALGRREEALVILTKGLETDPTDRAGLLNGVRAVILAAKNQPDLAEGAIRTTRGKAEYDHFHHTTFYIACAYAQMRRPQQALYWLRYSAEHGFPCYPLFERSSYLDPLRSDSLFAAFLANSRAEWERRKAALR